MMRIRHAAAGDISALLAIEAHAATAAHWTAEVYRTILSAAGAPRAVLVLEEGTAIVAFLVALCQGTEWEIENIAVSGPARRRGLGTRLVGELLGRARQAGAAGVYLEVRESNRAARALYEKWAFVEDGRRIGYYSGPVEDAILYRFSFAGGKPQPGPGVSKD
jgi:ribosomal-protein-alanine N-acetyltransferase